MIDEYFSSNPQAKWAAYALLAVYIWFMVIGPFMKLFTYDPNKDQGLEQSRSRWFLQLLIGLVPLVLFGYNYYKAANQPPPPPPVEKPFDFGAFESKLDVLREKIVNPQVVYLPYPSTATPVPVSEPSAPDTVPDVPDFPLPNKK